MPATSQQLDTAAKLARKMGELKRLMFELKELRIEYDVHQLGAVPDADWRIAGDVSHFTQATVSAYAGMIDRVDAAIQTVSAIPALPNGSPVPIVLFTRLARG